MPKPEITIEVNSEELDQAIEKANRLVELLREAQQIIDSLSCSCKESIEDRELMELQKKLGEAFTKKD